MRRRRRTTSVAAALVVAAGSALAAPPPAAHNFNSRANVTGMRYELIDLRPGDGIAPSVTFLDGLAQTSVELLKSGIFTGANHYAGGPSAQSFSMDMLPGGSAAAASGMGADGLGLFVMGSGSRLGGKNDGMLTSFESSGSLSSFGLQALLSPGTEMRWTGSFEVTAAADKWWGSRRSQSAGAELRIGYGATGDAAPTFQTYYVAAFANPWTGEQIRSQSGTFSFSHVNDGSEWASFGASIYASTLGGYGRLRADSMAAPIPEPSTYALMFAGLGVVGAVARRRAAK